MIAYTWGTRTIALGLVLTLLCPAYGGQCRCSISQEGDRACCCSNVAGQAMDRQQKGCCCPKSAKSGETDEQVDTVSTTGCRCRELVADSRVMIPATRPELPLQSPLIHAVGEIEPQLPSTIRQQSHTDAAIHFATGPPLRYIHCTWLV